MLAFKELVTLVDGEDKAFSREQSKQVFDELIGIFWIKTEKSPQVVRMCVNGR